MTLVEAKRGQKLIVTAIHGEEISLLALRFGIEAGSKISVQTNIAGGPVVILKNHLEFALGRELARAIEVEVNTN